MQPVALEVAGVGLFVSLCCVLTMYVWCNIAPLSTVNVLLYIHISQPSR